MLLSENGIVVSLSKFSVATPVLYEILSKVGDRIAMLGTVVVKPAHPAVITDVEIYVAVGEELGKPTIGSNPPAWCCPLG